MNLAWGSRSSLVCFVDVPFLFKSVILGQLVFGAQIKLFTLNVRKCLTGFRLLDLEKTAHTTSRTSSSHSVSYLLETSTEFLLIFQRDDVFELSAGVSFCPSVSIHWPMWLTSACLIFVSQQPHSSRTNPVGYDISFEHSDHQSTKKTADGCVGSVTCCAASLLTIPLSPKATDVSKGQWDDVSNTVSVQYEIKCVFFFLCSKKKYQIFAGSRFAEVTICCSFPPTLRWNEKLEKK